MFDPLAPLSLSIGGSEIARAKFVLSEGRLALEIISVSEEYAEAGDEDEVFPQDVRPE